MRQHSQRGQALFETFIALPLALLAIFTLFWTAKFAILSERLESDTRYAQQILDSSNLYTEYSLASLYDATSGKPSFLITCQTPPPQLISSTTTAIVNSIQFPRNALWSGTNVSPSCSIDHQGLLSNGKFSRDLLIGFQRTAIATQFSPSFGSKMLFPNGPGALPLRSQSMSMFVAASIADLELCFPSAYNAISASLARGDQNASEEFIVNQTTIHALPPTNNLALNTKCIGTPPKNAGPPVAERTATPPGGYAPATTQPNGQGTPGPGGIQQTGGNPNGYSQPTPQPGTSNAPGVTSTASGTTPGGNGNGQAPGSNANTGGTNGTPRPGTNAPPPAGNSNPSGSQNGSNGAPNDTTSAPPVTPLPGSTKPGTTIPPGGSGTQPNATPQPSKTTSAGAPPNNQPTANVSQPSATLQPSQGASPAPARTATPPPSSNSGSQSTPAPSNSASATPARTPVVTPPPGPAPNPNASPPGSTFG